MGDGSVVLGESGAQAVSSVMYCPSKCSSVIELVEMYQKGTCIPNPYAPARGSWVVKCLPDSLSY